MEMPHRLMHPRPQRVRLPLQPHKPAAGPYGGGGNGDRARSGAVGNDDTGARRVHQRSAPELDSDAPPRGAEVRVASSF
jgi:hypothetical protein